MNLLKKYRLMMPRIKFLHKPTLEEQDNDNIILSDRPAFLKKQLKQDKIKGEQNDSNRTDSTASH